MSPQLLDHTIVLVPYAYLQSPPAWLTQNFTLTQGGRHGDNKTENTLILFADGSYIELIAFIDDLPAHRANHWWGEKAPGIIDFAFTTTEEAGANYEALQRRLGEGRSVWYAAPVAGARKRPDGVEIRWEVTFPRGAVRGEVPFFCHDVTPRELRVPIAEEKTRHPCGAYGIKELNVVLPLPRAQELAEVYEAILGKCVRGEGDEEGIWRFRVGSVNAVKGCKAPEIVVRGLETNVVPREQAVILGDLVLGGLVDSGAGSTKSLDEQFRMVLALDNLSAQ